jgi:surfactin synthase thioesterase subunit
MSYGYNAHTAFSNAVTDISDVATSLLDRLDNERQPHEHKRPIIFISHSLGGIIVKKVLKTLFIFVSFLRR